LGRVDFTDSYFHLNFDFAGLEIIDNRDDMEQRRILRRHEDFIQSNRNSFLSVTSKVQENENLCISAHANVMSLIVRKEWTSLK
jgi:hypothetical protein